MLKIILSILTLLILITMGWLFFFQEGSSNKVVKEGSIIFFGDSLTAGIGANPGEDFPSLIAKNLDLSNVINAGVSGDTSEDALARIQKDVLDKNPSLVVVFLGGNDFLGKVAIGETVNNIDEIVRKISETDSAVILVHLKSNPLNDKYKEPAKEIAAKYKTALVIDILEGIFGNSNLMSDTVHPNGNGYEIMAKRIAPSVKKALD